MKRDSYTNLIAWKQSDRRKPLILQGARQVGKTFALQWLGHHHFKKCAYINFEKTPHLSQLFQDEINPKQILKDLGIKLGIDITPGDTLIIFDEIQESERALVSLKYFSEEAAEYAIAAAGSLLGLKNKSLKTFPVGKVNFLNIYPLTFFEFLDAIGQERLRNRLLEIKAYEPLPDILHTQLIKYLRIYFVVGGMPEAVKYYVETEKIDRVREIHQEILRSYELDFIKHATSSEAVKISKVWSIIPQQLAKENKKFVFSAIRKSVRGRDYESSLQWLIDAGLIHMCQQVSSPKLPLGAYGINTAFKVYMLDIGLLGAMSYLDESILVNGDQLFQEYHGALTENYVVQELIAKYQTPTYYWSSDYKAEVDIIFPYKNKIWPLEIKAGINVKSKSLKVYDEKFHPPILSRANLQNFDANGRYHNYPLYAVSLFPKNLDINILN